MALLALALAGSHGERARAQDHDARVFVAGVTDAAIEQLTDTTLAKPEREARFRILFRENFDIPAIGRFVLGRYRRRAPADVRAAFLDTFEDVMVGRFAPQFAKYGKTRFQIGMVREVAGRNQYVVNTVIAPPNREPIAIDWRVRLKSGRFKVLDVVAQGVSMAISLRSEYASVLKRSGGRVESLITSLRERGRNTATAGDAPN